MAFPRLTARAVIFDVYGTLMDVGEPPADAEERWRGLFEEVLGSPPPLEREAFAKRTREAVAQHHAVARARGIAWPEVLWPAVVAEVLPGVSELPAARFADFIFRQMQIARSIRLTGGAAECLRGLRGNGMLLGIASNAQAYTLRELEAALRDAGLDLSLFDPELRFWSFEHGFSKPDPHVFQILATRLAARGVRAAETLMVGDRRDNDILPALAQGWQAWQRRSPPEPGVAGGDLRQLLEWLFKPPSLACSAPSACFAVPEGQEQGNYGTRKGRTDE